MRGMFAAIAAASLLGLPPAQAAPAKPIPHRLSLATGVKFTENGQRLQLGDGLWGAIDARRGYSLYFADPRAGEVGAFVTVKESGRHQILGVRLKVAGGRLAEIETLVLRPKPGFVFGAPQDLKDKPIFH